MGINKYNALTLSICKLLISAPVYLKVMFVYLVPVAAFLGQPLCSAWNFTMASYDLFLRALWHSVARSI